MVVASSLGLDIPFLVDPSSVVPSSADPSQVVQPCLAIASSSVVALGPSSFEVKQPFEFKLPFEVVEV